MFRRAQVAVVPYSCTLTQLRAPAQNSQLGELPLLPMKIPDGAMAKSDAVRMSLVRDRSYIKTQASL